MSIQSSATMLASYTRINTHTSFTTVANYAEAKLTHRFIVAVQKNDIKYLHKISKKEFPVDALYRFEPGMEKMSALHYASKEGKLGVVKELLEHKCDINLATPFDRITPLMFACRMAATPCTRNAAQAQSGAQTQTRESVEVVRELLSHNADVNQEDQSGKTPLILACELGSLEVVRLLLDSGAEMDHAYREDELPDAISCALKNPSVDELEVDEMCDPYRSNNALIQACREHHCSVVQELLNRGCNVDASNTIGNTALHVAARSESRSVYAHRMTRAPMAGHARIVKRLLEQRPNVDAINKHGETPLKRAIDGIAEIMLWNVPLEDKIEEAKTFADIVHILIHYGADVSGMAYSVSKNSEDMRRCNALSLLIKKSAAVTSIDSVELHSKLYRCIQMLACAGCSVDEGEADFAEKNLIPETSALVDRLAITYNKPFSLKQCCRVMLRKTCLKPLINSVPGLGLPPSLCDYLLLRSEE